MLARTRGPWPKYHIPFEPPNFRYRSLTLTTSLLISFWTLKLWPLLAPDATPFSRLTHHRQQPDATLESIQSIVSFALVSPGRNTLANWDHRATAAAAHPQSSLKFNPVL